MKLVLTDQRSPQLVLPFPLEEIGLTPREVGVLEWVTLGKSNKVIGLILGISPRTVAKHLERIYSKFGVKSRTDVTVQFFVMNQQRLPAQP